MALQTHEIIAQLGGAFDEFRTEHKNKLEDIQARLDRQESRSNLQDIGFIAGSGRSSDSREQAEHRQAFQAFARRGKDSGLADLEIKAALSVGSDPDGGYAVPVVIDSQVEKLLLDQSPMRRICNVIPITTPNYHKLVDVGGTASGWVGETDARPITATPQLVKLMPYMGEIYANPAASQQSLDDISFDVEAFLTEGIVNEFAAKEGASFISGDGILKPKGLLAYPTATTSDATRAFGTLQHVISGEANGFAAASAAVSPADCLINLVYAVRMGYRQGACWLMNANTLSVISKFKTAVQGDLVWQRGLTEGQPSSLLGYPVYEDENMPNIAAGAFPVAFGNFKRAVTIVDRVGTRVLRDPYSSKPCVHFYATRRIGTLLNNSQAVKLLKISA
jgi:HK97 family phage major capsid protein